MAYNNQESSTIFSYLCYDTTPVTGENAKEEPSGTLTLTKVADIKDFPALGGAPEQIETTTLSNASSTFVTGVQSVDAFEFTANYTAASFQQLKKIQAENTARRYYLVFGKKEEGDTTTYGQEGIFYWVGTLSCWLDSGAVNGVKQTKISISASTETNLADDTVTVTSMSEPSTT